MKHDETMTTTQIASVLGVSSETIRSWSKEPSIAKHLSPMSSPGHGRTRLFNRDDLAVMTLVGNMRANGYSFEDIATDLANGVRADDTDLEEARALLDINEEKRYQLIISNLERQLSDARAENEELKRAVSERDKLAGKLESEVERAVRAENRVIDLSVELANLKQELGRLEGRLDNH